MLKTTLILSVFLLQFCNRQKEKIEPMTASLKTLTIKVEEADGTKQYTEKDIYPIIVENSTGSFKQTSTGLYYSGRVPSGSLRATVPDSKDFYGSHRDFTIKNDTTIILTVSGGYRWRKGI